MFRIRKRLEITVLMIFKCIQYNWIKVILCSPTGINLAHSLIKLKLKILGQSREQINIKILL